jgi:hypothetical protein
MTTPTPTTPTQIRHPWRATIRTAFAAVVALASLLPAVVAGAHLDAIVWVPQLLTVAATVTRVLAIPGVNLWLARYAPWLTATPTGPMIPAPPPPPPPPTAG